MAIAVVRRRLEILFAQAIALAGPDVGAPACYPDAPLPAERHVRRRGIGFFEVVAEPVVVVFRASVAFSLPRARPANEVSSRVAVLQLEHWFMLAKVRLR